MPDKNRDARTLFDEERDWLLAALRHVTKGGVIEHIDHIGSTSAGSPASKRSINHMHRPGLTVLRHWPFVNF